MWEMPAGILEDHLTPLENTLKEIEEETGYRKEDVIDIIKLDGGFVSPGYSTEAIHTFVGRLKKDAVKGEKNCDENESILDEGFFTYEEARELGAFEDVKTALAYYAYQAMPKKKIGIMGGAFDPVTNLHIRASLRAVEEFGLDKIIFEPVGDKYSYEDKSDVTSMEHRLNMLKSAVEAEGEGKIEIGTFDIDSSKESKLCPTIEVLRHYKELYGNAEIYFVCGSDNLKTMSKWKQAEKLLSEYKIIVMQRNEDNIHKDIIFKDELLLKNRKNILPMYDILENNVASSRIREAIEAGISITGMVPGVVKDYIQREKLYRK